MRWTPLHFGKHKGKTLPQIMFSDPDYFFWAYDAGVFQENLLSEARYIYARAISIRVPLLKGREMLVEYVIHKPTGSFGNLYFIPKDNFETYFPEPLYYAEIIDLSFPYRLKKYDKGGYKRLMRLVKILYFGEQRTRLTKARCEQFFADNSNFSL
jgi:hypothetical protein